MPKDPSSIMLKMLVGTWHKNKKLKHQKNYWRFSVVVVTSLAKSKIYLQQGRPFHSKKINALIAEYRLGLIRSSQFEAINADECFTDWISSVAAFDCCDQARSVS